MPQHKDHRIPYLIVAHIEEAIRVADLKHKDNSCTIEKEHQKIIYPYLYLNVAHPLYRLRSWALKKQNRDDLTSKLHHWHGLDYAAKMDIDKTNLKVHEDIVYFLQSIMDFCETGKGLMPARVPETTRKAFQGYLKTWVQGPLSTAMLWMDGTKSIHIIKHLYSSI